MKFTTSFILIDLGFLAVSGIALGYIASSLLLTIVAYLSPWLPVWMWYGDIFLYIHAVSLGAASTVGVIAVLAHKLHALRLCTLIIIGAFLVEIALTGITLIKREALEDAVHSDLGQSMEISQKYYSLNISDTQMWDEIQIEVNCCGVRSYKDWFGTKFGNGTSVPDSCCLLISTGCGVDIASSADPGDVIITEGCEQTLMQLIRKNVYYLIRSVWLPVLGLHVVLVLVLIYLSRQLVRESRLNIFSIYVINGGAKYKPLR